MENALAPAFLSLVAEDLIARQGTDLSDTIVVFPSIRAGLFFNRYLYGQAKKPLWAPRYQSLDSIFESVSVLRKGDNLQLIGELYSIYKEVFNAHSSLPTSETLDEFFFFGEILLNDFDDVDKNLVNARSLFSNLQDLDQLRDDFSHLSEDQIRTLITYFKQAFLGESSLKTAFWNIWNILGEVYTSFKAKLSAKGLAYPGMLMRSVIESETAAFPGTRYVFVGFNVLSECEKKLFTRLKDKSLFYWDYDSYYLKTEAGRFLADNIRRWGSALDNSHFHAFTAAPKNITLLASPSESGQSAVIPSWIDSLHKPPFFTQPDSAIVLCNEKLLPAVMHAIPPEKTGNVNITMGFPMTQTPVCSFLQTLAELQTYGYTAANRSFRYQSVLPVLRHPYTQLIFPEAINVERKIVNEHIFSPTIEILQDKRLFSPAGDVRKLAAYLLEIVQQLGIYFGQKSALEDSYNDLAVESVFRAYQVLNRLHDLVVTENWKLEKSTFLRLLRKLLSTVTIPFHGEPVKGLQVMGVLETRSLDFNNVLMLSVNEGIMPGSTNENTFIPQFLRVHFGLSTIDHQDSLYAYYFYRLLQRAENITLVYNTDATQTGKAEISRFLLQLLVDPALKGQIRRFSLQTSIKPWKPEAISIEKDPTLLQKLRQQYDCNINPEANRLSPTALNTYINCSFKFYQQYIEGLKTPEELSDELDSSVFGLIFHRAAEYLYKAIGGIPEEQRTFPAFVVLKEALSAYLQAPHRMEQLVTRAFEKEYFKGKPTDPKQFNGQQLINYKVICRLLTRLIEFDRQRAPFTIHGLEHSVSSFYTVDSMDNQPPLCLKIGGIIDRLEEKDRRLYIVDYKTSGKAKNYKSLEDLFLQKNNRAAHIFQTFVYASVFLQQEHTGSPVIPSLFYLQEAGKENYSPVILYDKIPVEDFETLRPEFEVLLKQKLAELFDPAVSFRQTEIVSTC
ncbi:MAG: PD-(D/E)XK nuclease family protein, partial [Dysgonamonadaceae bacterium]|nr:PD-(D/E)XK nuclease family protein [Dysgonamonadaceae bacterium]